MEKGADTMGCGWKTW